MFGLSIGKFVFDFDHFKGQGQGGHATFDCEYLVNGNKKGNYYYCHHIESRVWDLVRHI